MNTKKVWLVFGDIHERIGNLHKIPELDESEGIIVTGDLTNAGGIKEAEKILDPIIKTGKKIIVQPGNMDEVSVSNWLDEKGFNIHRKIKYLSTGLPCLGLGFSTFTPFNTPGEFSENDFASWLELCINKDPKLKDKDKGGDWLFISHMPPINSACDKLSNGISVGSQAVRNFIEKYQPTYCLCGHIHESAAMDHIGKTEILNPGTLADGGYILVTEFFEKGKPRVKAIIKTLA